VFEEKLFRISDKRYISYFDIGKGKKVLLFYTWMAKFKRGLDTCYKEF